MDFIRNLFTLFQRLQEIVRDGQSRRDLPGMAMQLFNEIRGGAAEDASGNGDGPAVYRGQRAQADKATPAAASRATARNRAARDADLPEPAVYRGSPEPEPEPDYAPARAEPRNADHVPDDVPEPAGAAPLKREDYDYQPASTPAAEPIEDQLESAVAPRAEPEEEEQPGPVNWDDDVGEPGAAAPVAASAPAPAPEPEPAPQPTPDPAEVTIPATAHEAPVPAQAAADAPQGRKTKKDGDEDRWFDLDDWQGTALKVAGVGAAAAATAAGAMAIKDRYFDGDDKEDADKDGQQPAIPLPAGDEPGVENSGADRRADGEGGEAGGGNREWAAAAAVAAPAVAAVLPKARDAAQDDEAKAEPSPDRDTGTQPAPSPATADEAAPAQPERRPHPVEIIPADPRNPATQPASQSLANPGIRLYGTMDAGMYAEFTEMLAEQAPGGPIVIALTTMEGDPDIARSMADDIRLLRDRGRREIIFLGKTAVYSAGMLFMAAFPVSHRYLTRATKLMISENKRAQPLELAGGSLRSVATQLEHARRDIERQIEQEDEDYRAISGGSNVSVQELREKAPHDWYITASEAKAMGLIAEVV